MEAAPAEAVLDLETLAESEEIQVAPDWVIEYDTELLDIVPDGDDWQITPLASFDATDINVDNGSRCRLTLTNATVITWPAQSFAAETEHMSVAVAAGEGAFPKDTTMSVSEIDDQKTIDGIQQVATESFTEVRRVHAVDITFYNAEGVEIEPQQPISAALTAKEAVAEDQEAVVVHVDDAGNAEIVDQVPAEEALIETPADDVAEAFVDDAGSACFVADAFSVYALVVRETLATQYIDAEGETWRIEVVYTEQANIPENATLQVSEVTDESYLNQAEEALTDGRRVSLARFFDITILDAEGNEVQPEAPVEVRATLAGEEILPEDVNVCAMHFDETVDVLDASERDGAVVFDAESFSVWGVVYTVHSA